MKSGWFAATILAGSALIEAVTHHEALLMLINATALVLCAAAGMWPTKKDA